MVQHHPVRVVILIKKTESGDVREMYWTTQNGWCWVSSNRARVRRCVCVCVCVRRGTGADLPIQSNEAMAFWWMTGLINHLYLQP